jgi:hypothetical protein
LNGVLNADLPKRVLGIRLLAHAATDKQHVFEVHRAVASASSSIPTRTLSRSWSSRAECKLLEQCVGLMGDFERATCLRVTALMTDNGTHHGQEWQVLDTEPSLFHTVRLPQHPTFAPCLLPKQTSQLRRRLAASSDELLAAEKARALGRGGRCVFDVLATGDLDMAVGVPTTTSLPVRLKEEYEEWNCCYISSRGPC